MTITTTIIFKDTHLWLLYYEFLFHVNIIVYDYEQLKHCSRGCCGSPPRMCIKYLHRQMIAAKTLHGGDASRTFNNIQKCLILTFIFTKHAFLLICSSLTNFSVKNGVNYTVVMELS